jgi:ATP phosphoribosyltransferase
MTIKVAVPNKGSLAENSALMLREAGYRQRTDGRDLTLIDPENDVEFYYLRPRDIALYVGSGDLDAGITGRDLLLDSKAAAKEVLALNFGQSTFRFASRLENLSQITDLSGRRIATAYPNLLQSYLSSHSISADIVALDGAVETAIGLGLADAIADVVSTGGTLRQAGLHVFGDPLLLSEAILVKGEKSNDNPAFSTLMRRLQGVVIARQYVLVDYDIESRLLTQATSITPGLESPTISSLAKEGWSAVRAMVLRKDINRIMDALWDIGARGILVTDIHACRL